ncbi:hypothetical protein EUTSA_v10001182mg, partial [Eutrema salsugineum]
MAFDRISELPDPLLYQILSYLPIIDSVKTGVLSKRWEFLWLNVSSLDFNVRDISKPYRKLFASFVNKFLELNRELRLQNLKIKYDECNIYPFPISGWIAIAVDRRKLQHLDLEIDNFMYMIDFIPVSVFKSKTLVSLKLVRVAIKNKFGLVVSLPCLKIMHLENIRYCCKDCHIIMEQLISGCPVLEDLNMVRNGRDFLKTLCVRSQTLKIFCLTFDVGIGSTDYSVEIDAPRLEYMSFKDNQSDRIVVKNLTSLFKIHVDTDFMVKFGGSPLEPEDLRKRDTIRDFLIGISSVRHMIISQRTLEILYRYSKLGPIPKLDKLHHLQATFSSSSLQLLPAFLESCPNLKNLILEFSVSNEPEQINFPNVPPCLTSTLEYVEIKKLIMR